MSFCIRIIADDDTVLFEQEHADGEQVLLSDVLLAAGLSHDRPCGGRGVCGKCAVRVQGELSPMSESESTRLGKELCAQGYRLACVARAMGTTFIYYNIFFIKKEEGGKEIKDYILLTFDKMLQEKQTMYTNCKQLLCIIFQK